MTTFTHHKTIKRMRQGSQNFLEKRESRVANLDPFHSLSSSSEMWSSGPEFLGRLGGGVCKDRLTGTIYSQERRMDICVHAALKKKGQVR